ncbi:MULTISPECIES: DUF1636 domain-containing protein [unclassified Paracoccus (in: a-proteobacteria)]|uniref:DUF1636 domain-containing protein n=1 Tax=unclassified Paracoccus (in: a-proteobacteria) TaxID=2688777 RepID=UPI0012B3F9BB|nr:MULTISPECIES: DUF1636 domain-containing protein [unclassified Paracoccus (in: a-proteobacteria)]UXU75985.1 DUF1636 domain-containing protein [Paracoccus sp. SMMA_5]UXU81894.1 DUF1636 domain-containing protein [Paracoccus sp. SMMA_5_TC]
MTITLHVCITCRAGVAPQPDQPPPGAQLLAALRARPLPPDLRIQPVECMSACARGAAIALSAPGRWTYVYGHMSPADADQILTGAAAYANAADGIVPWRQRVEIFRKRSLARIPPIG